MGCTESSSNKRLPREWYEQFWALRLSNSEINQLMHVFNKNDIDGTGSIDLFELCMFLDVERTAYANRVFNVFDINHTGKIDFREFVLSLWNYCTLDKASLEIFTFDLYDDDASGFLSHEQIVDMLTDLYGKKHMEVDRLAKSVLFELDQLNKQQPFTVDRFSKFCKHHHGMLFHAFQLQMKLRSKVCGEAFWERCSNRRVQLSSGKFISMGEIMKLHIRPELYEKLLKNGEMYTSGKKGKKRKKSAAQMVFENTGTVHERDETSHFTRI